MRSEAEIRNVMGACDIAGQTKLFDDAAEAFHFAAALSWALGDLSEIDTITDALEFAEEHDWQVPDPA